MDGVPELSRACAAVHGRRCAVGTSGLVPATVAAVVGRVRRVSTDSKSYAKVRGRSSGCRPMAGSGGRGVRGGAHRRARWDARGAQRVCRSRCTIAATLSPRRKSKLRAASRAAVGVVRASGADVVRAAPPIDVDKGTAFARADRRTAAVCFIGDDVGDLLRSERSTSSLSTASRWYASAPRPPRSARRRQRAACGRR